jgi:glycosyltransferase involved in cell wall biosynthesis
MTRPKLLWHSNAPHAPTGYGMQTALFAPRIAEHYDMAISSFWGVEGAPIVWEGIPVFPGMGGGTFGEEWLLAHAERFFGGDARDGLVLTLMDVWVLNPKIMAQMNSAAWVPVDHEPAPPRVVDFFAESGTVPIAMSKFGMQMLGRLDPLYVPHAVDCRQYQPKDRKTVRELTKLDEDTFVVGMVAANKGRPSRKAFTQAFQAFARFLEKHENSVLYLHTTLSRAHGDGEDLAELLEALEVPQANVRIADQYRMLFDPFGHKTMATIYSNLDVLLNPSMGEGFGVTMLEAQACFPASTPVTATDIRDVMEHRYTGDMFTVETERGDTIEATADHPFWTDQGWVAAGDLRIGDHQLLYTGGHAEAEHVHAGRLGDLVSSLRDDDAPRGSGEDGTDVRIGVGAEASPRSDEVLRADRRAAPGDCDERTARIHGGVDRRRGHGLNSEVPREVEAAHPDRELVCATHGLVVGDIHDAKHLHRAATTESVGRSHALPLSHRGLGIPPAVRGADPTLGYQAGADGVPRRVQSLEAVSEPRGSIDRPPVGTSPTRARPEYQAIRAISRRAVEDFPVYNLTTASGTYMAGGYLVHNCGVPVITTDATAMTEVVGAGWHVRPARGMGKGYWSGLKSWQQFPDVDDIHSALEECYALKPREREKLSAQARQHALGYDRDLVFDEYMLPALKAVEHRFANQQPVRIAPRKAVAA